MTQTSESDDELSRRFARLVIEEILHEPGRRLQDGFADQLLEFRKTLQAAQQDWRVGLASATADIARDIPEICARLKQVDGISESAMRLDRSLEVQGESLRQSLKRSHVEVLGQLVAINERVTQVLAKSTDSDEAGVSRVEGRIDDLAVAFAALRGSVALADGSSLIEFVTQTLAGSAERGEAQVSRVEGRIDDLVRAVAALRESAALAVAPSPALLESTGPQQTPPELGPTRTSPGAIGSTQFDAVGVRISRALVRGAALAITGFVVGLLTMYAIGALRTPAPDQAAPAKEASRPASTPPLADKPAAAGDQIDPSAGRPPPAAASAPVKRASDPAEQAPRKSAPGAPAKGKSQEASRKSDDRAQHAKQPASSSRP